MWSSAAVAHMLQGSMCCAFRDALLHTLVVPSGYLSHCCLSIILNQSGHSPLTSGINKAFFSEVPLTGFVFFFGPFSVSLEMMLCENPSISAVCEMSVYIYIYMQYYSM